MKLAVLVIFLTSLLFLRFIIFFTSVPQYHAGQVVHFQTTLFSEPTTNAKSQSFSVLLPNSFQKVFVSMPLFPSLSYGDRVIIGGPLQFSEKNNHQIISIKTYKTIMKDNNIPFYLIPLRTFREKVISLFQMTLPDTSGSLLLGIVFGIKAPMPLSFQKDLQVTGLLHVIAASGMNVTMIAGFLLSLFQRFFRRQVGILLTLFSILVYALLAGLGASILRAALLSGITFSAGLFGRQALSAFALFVTGWSMLFFSPAFLYDVGFQLSFAATLGIVLLKPFFDGFLPRKELLLVDDITTTTAAQLATLPILLGTFGTYGLLSIVVNGLVLWIVPILMIFGGCSACFGLFVPILGKVFLFLSLPFLLFFENVVSLFGNLPLALHIDSLPWAFIAGYYCLLFSLLFRPKKKEAITALT